MKLKEYKNKREIKFLTQLLANETTQGLVTTLHVNSGMKGVIDKLGYNYMGESRHDIAHNIYKLCQNSIIAIEQLAKEKIIDKLTKVTKHLLNNQTKENNCTLRYLLCTMETLR